LFHTNAAPNSNRPSIPATWWIAVASHRIKARPGAFVKCEDIDGLCSSNDKIGTATVTQRTLR
jgi:hypothetical protein